MHATKAAVEEGIVPGGGVALLRASAILESFAKDRNLDGDERLGVAIVRKASEEPTRWIAQNAGLEGSIVAAKIKESKDQHWGFNAQSEGYEDLVKVGVIDPTNVVRTALTNAASIASLLLTTEALVSEIPEKEKPAGSQPRYGRLLIAEERRSVPSGCVTVTRRPVSDFAIRESPRWRRPNDSHPSAISRCGCGAHVRAAGPAARRDLVQGDTFHASCGRR